jgi:hypothetical protein
MPQYQQGTMTDFDICLIKYLLEIMAVQQAKPAAEGKIVHPPVDYQALRRFRPLARRRAST